MEKTSFIIAILFITLGTFLSYTMASSKSYPKNSMIQSPNSSNSQAGVLFSHKEHVEEGINCFTCHHTAQSEQEIKACQSCHDDIRQEAKNTPEGFYQAWHDNTSKQACVGCHQTVGEREAPTSCKGCHSTREYSRKRARHNKHKN